MSGRSMRATFLTGIVVVAVLALSAATTAAKQSGTPPLPQCLHRVQKPCLGPADVRNAYNVDPLLQHGITGKGRTIAIVDSFGSPTIREDLHAFDRAFGLPDPQLDIRAPLGTRHPSHNGWEGETALDVEWAHAMAPDARILLLTSPVDETEGVQGLPEFLAVERYAVDHHLADVISQSWGATEDTLMDARGRAIVARFHNLYATAAKQGVTVLCGSGDDGAAGRDLSITHFFPYRAVSWPSSDPLVLAVGGTVLLPRKHNWEETAWSGSGGGVSKMYPEPAYQRSLPVATQRLLHGRRGLPDIALNAATPLLVYSHGRWIGAGGTSASGPIWAGLIALADSKAGHGLGSINDALYRLARSSRYGKDLYDVTLGSIKDPPGMQTKQSPLRAGPGWDPATGLGTPNAAELLPDLIREVDRTRAR